MRCAKVLLSSVLALVVINSCADEAQRGLGRAMVDAGTVLGGRTAREAGSGGAVNGGRGGIGGRGSIGGRGGGQSSERDAGSAVARDGGGGLLADAGQALVDAGKAMIDAAREQVPDAAAEAPTSTDGTRIKVRRIIEVGADGMRADIGLRWFDDTLQAECSPITAADGKRRCMPLSGVAFASGYFANAECTVPLVASQTCASPLFALASTTVTTQCQTNESRYNLYRVGSQHSGQLYAKNSGGACITSSTPPGYAHFVRGNEVPPADMVEMTTNFE